jgi:hypothetical protein
MGKWDRAGFGGVIMRTSSHFVCVPIRQTNRYLMFHTLRGAVDLVSDEIGLALERGEEINSMLSEVEAESLKRRGYLTGQTREQEEEQSHAALSIAARNTRPSVELIFRFPSSAPYRTAEGSDRLDEFFSVAADLEQGGLLVLVKLEISSPEVDRELMDRILEVAIARDYAIILEVTMAGIDALWPWLKSENFRHVTLISDKSNMSPDAGRIAEKIALFFERQVYVSWKCNVDGLSAEQIDAVRAIRDRVRQKYSNFILLLLSDEREGEAEPYSLPSGGGHLPVVNSENVGVLLTMLRFVTRSDLINYNPFFSLEPDKLIYDLASEELFYQSAGSEVSLSDVNELRQYIRIPEERPLSLEIIEQGSACPSCKYALVCGRDWIGKCGYPDINRCAASFEQRLKQVLPLLFFNLQGNWRPPGADRAKKQG